ncbi:putative trihelix transcription factor GT-3b-like [Capsicum annuum]|nr:putative trihelix transcription factor GT-3b-like [Capsicum annuum]
MNLPIHLPLKMDDEKMFEVFEVPTTLVDTVFHLSKESIGKLKAKENTEMGVKSISSLQAFLAHLWRAINRCRKHDAEEEVVINIIVAGTRSRLNPPLPEGYFGNAIHYKKVKTNARELLENGLGWAAMRINKMVVAQNSEEVVKMYKDWVENPILITKG